MRLSILLCCLGLAIAALLSSHAEVLSTGAPAGAPTGWCVPQQIPSPTSVDLAGLRALRKSLLGVMRPIGPRYAWGTIGSANMWTDNAPLRILTTSDGRWPATYEMRSWAVSRDNVAASVLMFSSAGQARTLFEAAAGTRCRRAAKATLAASPPGARDLVWVNPDGPTEEDVLLLRGERVYRIADVGPGANHASAVKRRRGLRIVSRLACSLPAAGCTGSGPTDTGPTRRSVAQRSSCSGSCSTAVDSTSAGGERRAPGAKRSALAAKRISRGS